MTTHIELGVYRMFAKRNLPINQVCIVKFVTNNSQQAYCALLKVFSNSNIRYAVCNFLRENKAFSRSQVNRCF